MADYIQVDPNTFINPDQVTAIRGATKGEMKNREYPITTILLENGSKFFIHGYPEDIIKKLKKEKND